MTPSTGLMRDIYATYVAAHSNDSSEELFDRWLFRIKASDAAELDKLLDAGAYQASIDE